ncbi:carnitine dehydratase [Candidatus Atribacteria bacterium HGW-Atribacteria-1]|nr:MAG: carnitine dehydratase [Candidatus Atribacteria bacterium HGW-Atribacteria-1]
MKRKKPLEDIVVLDLTRVLAGPYCSMILANLGAKIIKVERPETGDDARSFGPYKNGQSAYFVSLNRGKKSIAIDLKKPEGKQIIKELTKVSDVVIENFKPGTMRKLGLSYDVLNKINSRIVYAAVSGFGHTGPYSEKPAYDMIAQALGGIMSITGQPGGEPTRVGSSIGDIIAGMFGAIGIIAALYEKVFTGKGQMVDIAMLDGQVAVLENAIARYAISGEVPGPIGSRHPSITPFGGFKTKNSWVIIACGNQAIWEKFCKAVDREDLLEVEEFKTNEKRTENYEKIKPILDEIILQKTTEEWLKILESNGVPSSAINTVDKLFNDPQVKARKMIIETEQPDMGKIYVAGNPIKLSTLTEEVVTDPAPKIGEHTVEILKTYLNYTDVKINELRKKQIIF